MYPRGPVVPVGNPEYQAKVAVWRQFAKDYPGFCPKCGLPEEKCIHQHLKSFGDTRAIVVVELKEKYPKALQVFSNDELARLPLPNDSMARWVRVGFFTELVKRGITHIRGLGSCLGPRRGVGSRPSH